MKNLTNGYLFAYYSFKHQIIKLAGIVVIVLTSMSIVTASLLVASTGGSLMNKILLSVLLLSVLIKFYEWVFIRLLESLTYKTEKLSDIVLFNYSQKEVMLNSLNRSINTTSLIGGSVDFAFKSAKKHLKIILNLIKMAKDNMGKK